MNKSRIYFKNNPWPEGHPVQAFKWSAKLIDGHVWFDLHLESEDYYSERAVEEADDIEYPSDWDAPIVWGNYHACTLSSTFWDNQGFRVCRLAEYTPAYFNDRRFEVDSHPEDIEDWDALAFHIYLLGHDAVAEHQIHFEQVAGTENFNIHWTGKIALAYSGQSKFEHEFSAYIENLIFPQLIFDENSD